jgi:membrane protease YdiL (CAAX protease family)
MSDAPNRWKVWVLFEIAALAAFAAGVGIELITTTSREGLLVGHPALVGASFFALAGVAAAADLILSRRQAQTTARVTGVLDILPAIIAIAVFVLGYLLARDLASDSANAPIWASFGAHLSLMAMVVVVWRPARLWLAWLRRLPKPNFGALLPVVKDLRVMALSVSICFIVGSLVFLSLDSRSNEMAWLQVLLLLIIGPVTEELFFRGFLQTTIDGAPYQHVDDPTLGRVLAAPYAAGVATIRILPIPKWQSEIEEILDEVSPHEGGKRVSIISRGVLIAAGALTLMHLPKLVLAPGFLGAVSPAGKLFGIASGSTVLVNLLALGTIFGASLIFGAAYRTTGRLMYPIGLHFGLNLPFAIALF